MKSDNMHLEVLRKYIGLLHFGIPIDELESLLLIFPKIQICNAFWLLDQQSHLTPEKFVLATLPRILKQANKQTQLRYKKSADKVDGKIHWSRTFKERAASDCHPNLHVYSESRNYYDTPENQVLKYFLQTTQKACSTISMEIRMGTCGNLHNTLWRGNDAILTCLEVTVHNALRHPILAEVSEIPSITPYHRTSISANRMREYGEACQLYDHWSSILRLDLYRDLSYLANGMVILPGKTCERSQSWMKLAVLASSRNSNSESMQLRQHDQQV